MHTMMFTQTQAQQPTNNPFPFTSKVFKAVDTLRQRAARLPKVKNSQQLLGSPAMGSAFHRQLGTPCWGLPDHVSPHGLIWVAKSCNQLQV